MIRDNIRRFTILLQFLPLLSAGSSADFLTLPGEIGHPGGTLSISQRSEPRTLNPLSALDVSSRTVIGLINADLIHVNRLTQKTESALAQSWSVSTDGRQYTMHLRPGLRFSDGQPCTADDVVFSFESYLDERVHSPQRDLLIISGKPISIRKVNDTTVIFTLAQPYAAAERLFDCIAVLPRHLLQQLRDSGSLGTAWGLGTPPEKIAGLGPFRMRKYLPGERIVLERNPFYWKVDSRGQHLPYLDGIVSSFVTNADAQAMRFEAGETDVIGDLSAADYAVLAPNQSRRHFHLYDVGPGLEYDFLFFNQNQLGPDAGPGRLKAQSWFTQLNFRKALSRAVDRDAIVRIAFRGRASPLSVQTTPGDKLWKDDDIPAPVHSFAQARQMLRDCGFAWDPDGSLIDSNGAAVKFSLTVNAGNPQQLQMATLIEQDFKQIGIEMMLDQLDFHTFLNRVFASYKYDSALMGLSGGDADPNSQLNVLSSNGGTHVWRLTGHDREPAWQMEVDRLMQDQFVARSYAERKRIYDRVQALVDQNVPVLFLVSPDVLVGAKDRVGNFRPAILSDSTLWNAEQLFFR